ncbi:MAG: protein kinase domain-containing protein, partial [Armatimonadota bacterium]
RRIAAAVCDALAYAHGRGVVHRDVKPDNIHLLPDGRVKLTDFGIARILDDTALTVAGQVYGTPSYMAPEQIRGTAVDPRTDLFALGLVLFEMVAGAKPFAADRIETVAYRIVHEPTPPLPTGPPDLDAIVRRATKKDPAARFASASAMAEALRAGSSPRVGNQTVAGTRVGAAPRIVGDATVAATAAFPAHPPNSPNPDPLPAAEPVRPSATRWPLALAGVLILGIATVAVVGLARVAGRNFAVRAGVDAADAALGQAVAAYQAGDHERAAALFALVRADPKAGDATAMKARTYEGYSYRSLAHAAQDRQDWTSAVRWHRKAVECLPDDATGRDELAKAEEIARSQGAPIPDPDPEPDRTTEHPRPPVQGTPGVTAGDLAARNQRNAT